MTDSHDLETPHDRLVRLLGEIAAPPQVIDLTSAVPNWRLPDLALAELTQAQAWAANAPAQGVDELVAALKVWLASSFALNSDAVGAEPIATVGSREGLASAIASALLAAAPNRRAVLLPEASYHALSGAVVCANGSVRDVGAARGERLSRVLASLNEEALRSVCALVFPFPTGLYAPSETKRTLRAVLDIARDHNVMVIADECMLELYEDARPPGFLDVVRDLGYFPDHLVVSSSLSKRSFVSGLRSACLVASQETSRQLHKVRKHISPVPPRPVQHASAHLWRDQHRDATIRQHVSRSRRLLAEKYGQIFKVQLPDCGLYGWIAVEDDIRAAALAFGAGVRTMPASLLLRSPTASDAGALRIALDGDHDKLAQGLDLLVASLARLRP